MEETDLRASLSRATIGCAFGIPVRLSLRLWHLILDDLFACLISAYTIFSSLDVTVGHGVFLKVGEKPNV